MSGLRGGGGTDPRGGDQHRRGPTGMSGAEPRSAIYRDADHVVTAPAEVSGLRRVLGTVCGTKPCHAGTLGRDGHPDRIRSDALIRRRKAQRGPIVGHHFGYADPYTARGARVRIPALRCRAESANPEVGVSTIAIPAFGPCGDVAPYTGLGLRLQEAGHRVIIAAMQAQAPLVTDVGLEYRWLPRDVEDETRRSANAQRILESERVWPSRRMLRDMVDDMRDVAFAVADAARDADLLLIPVTASLFGFHIAEGLGIPGIGVFLQPLAPTGDFPPSILGIRSYGREGNRALARLVAMGEMPYMSLINDVRELFGLPPTTPRAHVQNRLNQWTVLHGFSRTVVPRPSDWRAGLEVVGYWWPPARRDWRPAPELVDFLAAGPPPVYVGLGSTATVRGEQYSEVISAALRRAQVRGVVHAGWARLHCSGDDVITIDDTPHEWLFPQMSAVVHHGGAGTTARGLYAGVPAVPIPGIMDQPFWAKRLQLLGVAPGAIRRSDLNAGRLASLITAAVEDRRYAVCAQAISTRLRDEDGARRVVDVVDGFLE